MPDPELKPTPPPGRRGADWILLDKVAYIADRRNGTTAEGFTHAGQAVQVTLWLADPPGSSHLLVHCPGLNKADFSVVPATIVCSDKDVAILQIHFPSCPSINPVDREQCRYFVYTADHDHPSLDLLPVPIPLCYGNDELGLLPTSSIVLRQHSFPLGTGDYNLHVFSSKTWAWSTRLARLALKPNNGALPLCHTTHEVIVLDGSTLGFVDLWDGILCCRVDDDDDESPVLPLRLIRLPPPMQINTSMFDRASGIRDVVCVDGVIKFVEIANRKRLVLSEPGHDLVSHKSVLHDWELDELASSVADDTKDPYVYACDGWVAVTWNRQTGSDQWLRDCQVDADDVTVSSPKHFDLLPQLFSSHSAGKLKLNKNVPMFAPTFVPQDRGVAYLMCCLEIMDKTACVVLAIDTREKTLQALSFSTQRDSDLFRAYRPYALSKHMSMAPRNSRGTHLPFGVLRCIYIFVL
ncbi:unnamed protein product [Urochloa decumbens]|uniref:DUF1618 domain-containing protein n=1 Tax=Urochloa decumbens TaxID=240449 RepID=A0ABC8X4C2_9POAL